jgi:outer membrane protein OmpA-like peptidoglycan-associated protein
MKKITLVALMVTFSLGAFAQGGERGPFLTNRFGDNWFISAGGGVNMYWGEADRAAKLSKRLAPALDVALGKWFTPSVGARLEYSGLSAKGGTVAGAPFAVGGMVSNGKHSYFPKKFNYTYVHADFLWNLSTALGGYKPSRRWEFIPFAGFGPAWAKGTTGTKKSIHEMGLTGGLINKFRLGNALDLNLEGRGMLVKQTFDGVTGGRRGEGMLTLTAGLTYKFGKRVFSKPVVTPPADYSAYHDRIRMLEGDLNAQKAKADQLAKDLAAARNAKPEAKTEYVFPKVAVFFPLGKATLSKKELVNIDFIAAAIKKLPAGQKVMLDGNADPNTGTKKGNMALSERRAKAVYEALVAAGVNPAQLQMVANGDTKEPMGRNKPALNRVLIIEQ